MSTKQNKSKKKSQESDSSERMGLKNRSNGSDGIVNELRKVLQTSLQPELNDDTQDERYSTPEESPKKKNIVNGARSPQRKIANDENSTKDFGNISFQIDLIATAIFVLSVATRFHNLSYPNSIVFDELHYGRYASLYLRRVFFFDPHPPLGKQLIAASTALFDPSYNGTFRYTRIGTQYANWVPILGMRLAPALCGSLLPSISYLFCRELGISPTFSILSALLIIFDNALLIQSRYVLMEMPLIVFGLLSLLFAVKCTKRSQTNQGVMIIFGCLSALFGTLSMCVKYIGTFYLCLSAFIIFWDWWTKYVPRHDMSTKIILRKIGIVYSVFFITFATTYLSIFYIHLSILTKAGPHDSVMTSAFQASLEGGLASIIKGQPLQVVHGSQVTLRHALGRPCWLHSHGLHNYPIKYSDGRGSSHQQQVTCYSFKDVNNWWIIKRPDVDNLAVNETKDIIKHDDEIHIVHGLSGRLLNSHDVAAPQSPQNQEVSCYIDHNVSMSAEPLWRVDVVSGCSTFKSEDCEWHAVKSTVRLIHVSTGQALRMSGKQLPKWGFNQHEVVADRIVVQDDTVWNVEEHRYTKSEKDREKELIEAEMIPTKPTSLSFWSKFIELQWKMIVSSGGSGTQSDTPHAYSSFPSEWLLLTRGIAYWIGAGNNSQIHFVGNPIIWLSGSFALVLHFGIIAWYALRRRRLCYDINEEEWTTIVLQSRICLGGYLLTYVYHFCVDRTLFLHHYLPSYVFKLILFTCTLHHIHHITKYSKLRIIFAPLLILWLIAALYTFVKLIPTTYGEPSLTASELESLKWRETWDFIIQTKN